MLHYHLLELCLLSLIFASHQAILRNCKPKSCQNGPNFTFPFYFPDVNRPSYICGLPGFELTCNNNGNPVLQFPEDNVYVVTNISYETQTLRVYNEAVSFVQLNECLPNMRNTTLPSQFSFVNTIWLHMFPNCSHAINGSLWQHHVICNSNYRGYDLAMYEYGPGWSTAIRICNKHVVAPVDKVSNASNIYTGLKRGFELKWAAVNRSLNVAPSPLTLAPSPAGDLDPDPAPAQPPQSQLNLQKAKSRKKC